MPPALVELAAPIAQAMGALHQIERTQQLAPHADVALNHLRGALAQLQAQPTTHPAVAQALDAVASSLSLVHSLSRMANGPQGWNTAQPPGPLPQAAPQAPPPQAPPPQAPPPHAPPPQAAAPVPVRTQAMAQKAPVQPAPQPQVQQAPPQQPSQPQMQAPPQQFAPAPAPQQQFTAPQPQRMSNPQPSFPQGSPSGGQPQMVARDPFAPPAGPPAGMPAGGVHMPPPAGPPATPSMPVPAPPAGNLQLVNADLGAHSPTNFFKGLAGNDIIDHGGLFVSTYILPKIGHPVRLKVSLPGGYEFEANAVVKWTREDGGGDAPPGFGAQFTQITPEARQLVYRYVRNREPMFYDDL
ncbi:MAG TPA: PilZ domain-containing protein [Labilithrix sp.]|nr:PilZ domain-containing protein [Labilithrix sp.]